MRRFLIAVLSVLAVVSLAPHAGAQAKKQLAFGCTAAASSYYPYCVGAAKAINEGVSEISVDVVATGGATDNMRRIRKDDIDLWIAAASAPYNAYRALQAFKQDSPQDDLRAMWYWTDAPINWVVRKGEGITSLKALNGRDFSAGGLGTATEQITYEIFGLLGIQPKYHRGGMADAKEAFQNRRVVGFTKAGLPPDSYISEMAIFFPVEILGLSAEEMKNITRQFPYYTPYTVPAAAYRGQELAVTIASVPFAAGASTKLSADLAYKILKALYGPKGRKEWEVTYPPAAKFDHLEAARLSSIPLHAGAVRYYLEQGVKLPKEVIPPEYK